MVKYSGEETGKPVGPGWLARGAEALHPVRFLKMSNNSPKEFAKELTREADQYHRFNLIVADLCSMKMLYITNRPTDDGQLVIEVSPGIQFFDKCKDRHSMAQG